MEIVLNERLIEKQGLTPEEVKEIYNLHSIKDNLFENISTLNPKIPEELEMIRHAAVELRDIEFAMQRAWHFPESTSHHTHWLYIPHCNCPKMDNADMFGVDDEKYGRWSTGKCPVHNPSPYGEEGVGDRARRIERDAHQQASEDVRTLEENWDKNE